MPESVTDRPTKSHEYIFLLAKSDRYHFDAEAIKEECVKTGLIADLQGGAGAGKIGPNWAPENVRNRHSVWMISTYATPEAHFATYPIELPELCIRASAPVDGVVLDPFSGAATTGLACLKTSRRYLGIELNEAYHAIAARRLQREGRGGTSNP